MPAHVLIAGGGIAGIAAALRLAERGTRVTLLETRRKLGGRATSFVDPRTGRTLDNCQHVALACCTTYLDLLDRLGVRHLLDWTEEQHWIDPHGRVSTIRPAPGFPAPLHFTPSLLRAGFLSTRDVAAIGLATAAILRTDRSRWTGTTFRAFLDRHHQTLGALARFWTPIIVSACNLTLERVAASSALHVMQEGFLASRDAARIGLSRVPLLQLYDSAEHAIRNAGGEIRLGAGVERIHDRSVTTADGETITADRVVCALPVERAARVLAPDPDDPRIANLARFECSPILAVHLEFDRPVLTLPHAVLVDAGTQWLFRKDPEGRHVHAVISAADDWVDLPEPVIVERVLADIRRALPVARTAHVIASRTVKEKRATFAPTSETEAIRPAALGPRPDSLILAGDYTATGWPATMEGAARSGYIAAAHALGLDPAALLPPPMPCARLARLLGLRPQGAAPASPGRTARTAPSAPLPPLDTPYVQNPSIRAASSARVVRID